MAQAQEVIVKKSREEWAAVINADWRKSIESIMQTGRDLLRAKEDLPNGQFGQMIKEDLGFGRRVAQHLMRIVAHPMIGDAKTSAHLPASWNVLYELSRLSEEDFKWAEAKGLIGPDTTVRKARGLKSALDTPQGEIAERETKPTMLPSPNEAREIARETGRFVASSDGNIYSGATEEEAGDHKARRQQIYSVRDAIELIANTKPPAEWLTDAEAWWLHNFDISNATTAMDWLASLVAEWESDDGK